MTTYLARAVSSAFFNVELRGLASSSHCTPLFTESHDETLTKIPFQGISEPTVVGYLSKFRQAVGRTFYTVLHPGLESESFVDLRWLRTEALHQDMNNGIVRFIHRIARCQQAPQTSVDPGVQDGD
ncbi:hypothetical protein MRX96_009942 [Rhipicephalus microplus]